MMLDMRRTFDEMVLQYSADAERAEAILENQFYQTVATSLAGTQEYMAMEKLGQLLAEDKWDLIVVDTPPSRNALDFLDAPQAPRQLHGQPAVAAAARPGPGHRQAGHGRRRSGDEGAVDGLGSQMLADAAGFVQALDATFGGFREKADRTYELLKRRGTQFVVVVGGRAGRAARGIVLRRPAVARRTCRLAGLILNRTHPMLCDVAGRARPARRPTALDGRGGDTGALAAALLRIHADRAQTAKREVRLLSRFTGANPRVAIVGVPSLPFDVSDLEALRAIADQITGEAPALDLT